MNEPMTAEAAMRTLEEARRAYAVKPEPAKRSEAYNRGRSAHWKLYRPELVADELKAWHRDPAEIDAALEKTGFKKAVRIREELIRWKTRLLAEERAITAEYEELNAKRVELRRRREIVRYALVNVRNVLRLPRKEAT